MLHALAQHPLPRFIKHTEPQQLGHLTIYLGHFKWCPDCIIHCIIGVPNHKWLPSSPGSTLPTTNSSGI